MEVLDKVGYSNRLNPLEVLPLDGEGGSSLSGETEGVKREAFQIFSKVTHSTAASQRSPSPIKGEDL